MSLSLFTGFYLGEYIAIVLSCLFLGNIALITLTTTNYKNLCEFFDKCASKLEKNSKDFATVLKGNPSRKISFVILLTIVLCIMSEIILTVPFILNVSNFSSELSEYPFLDDNSLSYSGEFHDRYINIYWATCWSMGLFISALIVSLTSIICIYGSYIYNKRKIKQRNDPDKFSAVVKQYSESEKIVNFDSNHGYP